MSEPTGSPSSELIDALFASDAASALTNRAARHLEALEMGLSGLVVLVERMGLQDVLSIARDGMDGDSDQGKLLRAGLAALEARGVQVPDTNLFDDISAQEPG